MHIPYAHLKTIDGEEVQEISKEVFEKILEKLDTREFVQKKHTLYFVNVNAKVEGIKFFRDDYLETIR